MGKPLLAAFASFEQEPFASGSIAQMHRATDLSGQPLAVKVRHPNVVERIQTDFALMLMLADFTARLANSNPNPNRNPNPNPNPSPNPDPDPDPDQARVPGLRWLNLKSSVSQFSSTMVAQTRLDIEAEVRLRLSSP